MGRRHIYRFYGQRWIDAPVTAFSREFPCKYDANIAWVAVMPCSECFVAGIGTPRHRTAGWREVLCLPFLIITLKMTILRPEKPPFCEAGWIEVSSPWRTWLLPALIK